MKKTHWIPRFLFGLTIACITPFLMCFIPYLIYRMASVYVPSNCDNFTKDPIFTIPLDTTPDTISQWAADVYTKTERWHQWEGENNSLVMMWYGDGTEHRALFNNQTDKLEYVLHDYWVNEGISGHQLVTCFGEPTYYQAVWEPNPHGEWLAIELVYPDEGLIFRGHQSRFPFVEWMDPHAWTEFGQVRHFPPVTSQEELSPYLSNLYSGTWDDEGWAEVALRQWEGWDKIQILTDEETANGSPRAPAIATALAATFLITPSFSTQDDLSSSACQAVVSPISYNLQFGAATREETRQSLRILYQHLFGTDEHPIDSSSRSDGDTRWEVLTWNAHEEEVSNIEAYTANFENGVLQNAEIRVRGRISAYITCFGNPSDAILTIRNTPNGRLQSLYLLFPAQGMVTGTYLFDGEIEPPHEQFPVMMIYQSNPQADGVTLLQSAMAPWEAITFEEWVADLQPWQGFEQLVITEK